MDMLEAIREKITEVKEEVLDKVKRAVKVNTIEEADASFEISAFKKLDSHYLNIFLILGGKGICIDVWKLDKEVDPDDE